ncbi:Lipopolysaccharide heptosyltransferase 1 [Aquicella siphonis]|uniref:Lipopolysaccharide heptosyltransferase 1 n=1 Tax=Aquicella siphonis TaxID=254247 RepID=A0A5E4PD97_9COXI|nr:lipopolysaccharide heptosyltransferase I [Aquicella siphonis]VVC74889.1 Lipopolysaccharide heptosyltransferase 1 [Aquicella siphonis]
MRVLLIKTSSMGDIIHTFPALTDAGRAIPGITFDWMVEDVFSDIPLWHPRVNRVIPVALRRWRKNVFSRDTRAGLGQVREQLKKQRYDLVLDAQGLVKSALLIFLADGPRAGLDWRSAREPLASLVYQRKLNVNFYQHAIVRMRSLFSLSLDYALPDLQPEFDLNRQMFQANTSGEKYLVFLFGTTWTSKQWPESYWMRLAELAGQAGYRVKVSGNSPDEIKAAQRIGQAGAAVDVLPRLKISEMAALLANAAAAVAVDTGFGHLAAALGVPTVSLYGSTNPAYTGALGKSSVHLAANFSCAPCLSRECTYKKPSRVTPACYETVDPARVWSVLLPLLSPAS